MVQIKTDKLTLRISPELKGALRELAARENRTVTNMVETMILKFADNAGVKIRSRAKKDTSGEGHA